MSDGEDAVMRLLGGPPRALPVRVGPPRRPVAGPGAPVPAAPRSSSAGGGAGGSTATAGDRCRLLPLDRGRFRCADGRGGTGRTVHVRRKPHRPGRPGTVPRAIRHARCLAAQADRPARGGDQRRRQRRLGRTRNRRRGAGLRRRGLREITPTITILRSTSPPAAASPSRYILLHIDDIPASCWRRTLAGCCARSPRAPRIVSPVGARRAWRARCPTGDCSTRSRPR